MLRFSISEEFIRSAACHSKQNTQTIAPVKEILMPGAILSSGFTAHTLAQNDEKYLLTTLLMLNFMGIPIAPDLHITQLNAGLADVPSGDDFFRMTVDPESKFDVILFAYLYYGDTSSEEYSRGAKYWTSPKSYEPENWKNRITEIDPRYVFNVTSLDAAYDRKPEEPPLRQILNDSAYKHLTQANIYDPPRTVDIFTRQDIFEDHGQFNNSGYACSLGGCHISKLSP